MERPLFSEMLLERRMQLGLSIKQASNVLRLKEEVLIAFEEGDFESIPKSGYAQGMLSSYARYLGLNAKTVVNQFSQDLFEHERGAGSHEARRRSRQNRNRSDGPLYQTPQANVGKHQRRTYVESHGFLPTSGGFAGDMGDFATTSSPRPRYSSASHDTGNLSSQSTGSFASRVPISTTPTPLTQTARQRQGAHYAYTSQEQYGATTGRHYASGYGMDDVTTRRVRPSQYQDDLRLDNEVGSYESAASSTGRISSRNIANTQRPNVRRRSSSETRAQMRNRNRVTGPAHGGLVGMVEYFFQDRMRVTVLIVAGLFIALLLIVTFGVRSCLNSNQPSGKSVTVTSTDSNKVEATVDDTAASEEDKRTREEAAAAKAAETEASSAERTVEVTVEEGRVTWLEIEYDGNSDIAETVTGPWNRTYTVRQSISINVNDTTAVTVTENGKRLEFESKASGIGTITITVSKKGESDTSDSSADQQVVDNTQVTDESTYTDDTSYVNQPTQQTTGEQGYNDYSQNYTDNTQNYNDYDQGTTYNQQEQTQTNTQTNTQNQQGTGATSPYPGYALDTDGYYYGEDGYYDAQGNFYSY